MDSGIFFTVETDEDFLRLCTDWLSWRMISKELGVGRSRAHQIMGTFAPEDCASVSVQIPGYDSRVCKYVRRAAFENLMRRRRGNPKWKDTAFQQEMARRRWEGHKKGPLPPADEYGSSTFNHQPFAAFSGRKWHTLGNGLPRVRVHARLIKI